MTHQRGCNINFLITQDAGLAQSVEQRTENPRVRGSIPRPGTSFQLGAIFQLPYFFCSRRYRLFSFVYTFNPDGRFGIIVKLPRGDVKSQWARLRPSWSPSKIAIKSSSRTSRRTSIFEGVERQGIAIEEKVLQKNSYSPFHPSLH